MKRQRQLFGFIVMAVFFASAGLTGTAHAASAGPTSYSPIGVQPNPSLNGNVTWSTFNSTWAWNEYNSTTGNLSYISASMSQDYTNPVMVNPTDIIAPNVLQGDSLGSSNIKWSNTSKWVLSNGASGSVSSISSYTQDGQLMVKVTGNGSASASTSSAGIEFPLSGLPSTNPNFDYVTVAYYLSAPAGFSSDLQVLNWTTSSGPNGTSFVNYNNQSLVSGSFDTPAAVPYYASFSLGQLQTVQKYTATFNLSGNGAAYGAEPTIYINKPAASGSENYTLYITGIAVSTTALTLGPKTYGTITAQEAGNVTGSFDIQKYTPSFKSTIIDSGYTAAISQEASDLTNYTISQAPLQSGNYTEQVTYQFTYGLPAAPDLTYGGFNFTEKLLVPGSQYVTIDLNGISYLSTYNGVKNDSTINLGSVNPTSTITYLSIVDYTAAQWDGISAPPGLFTVQGIEFTWYELVGGIGTILGLGGGAAYARKQRAPLREVNK